MVGPERGIHREDVAMRVALALRLRGALVFRRRDDSRLAAWRILRRIEWQVRHSDRFEDTTRYGRGDKYVAFGFRDTRRRDRLASLDDPFEVLRPQRTPEVGRALRRQVAEVERHQIAI